MTPLQILTRARKLLSNPKRWCQWTSAKDKNGLSVSPFSKNAVSFCAYGSIERVTDGDIGECALILDKEAGRISKKKGDLVGYNDARGRTHAQILALFDSAISRLKAKK